MHSQIYPSSTKYYNFVCIWMTGVNSETWLAPHPCQALLQSVQDDKLWEVEVLFASFANYPLWRKHMRRLLKLLYIGQRIWSSFPCANQIHATPHDTSNHSVDFLCGNEVIIWFHKSQFRGWQITRQGQEDYVCRLCSPPPQPPSLSDRQVNLAADMILLSSPSPIINQRNTLLLNSLIKRTVHLILFLNRICYN